MSNQTTLVFHKQYLASKLEILDSKKMNHKALTRIRRYKESSNRNNQRKMPFNLLANIKLACVILQDWYDTNQYLASKLELFYSKKWNHTALTRIRRYEQFSNRNKQQNTTSNLLASSKLA